MRLPPFLVPLPPPHLSPSSCIHSSFKHVSSATQGSSHTLWFPPLSDNEDEEAMTLLMMIPGNPGLVDFYIPFLSSLQQELGEEKGLAILAKGHLGHAPPLEAPPKSSLGLTSQVQSFVEVYDAVREVYPPGKVKVVLIGHSVGAWIALQVLKSRQDVDGVFLLFPTISNIASTPNGKRLSWLFGPPLPSFISTISRLTSMIPLALLSHLPNFSSWPPSQLQVLKSLITSPDTVFATLTMAGDEMNTIKSLDGVADVLIKAHAEKKLWIYYAEKDDWVGEEKTQVLKLLMCDEDTVRVVRGQEGVPHSFCITHSKELSEQCASWLDTSRQ